ncbi:MAG TPA: hypothetical protein VGH95_05475 [Candidatus Aquirickettsiella sp.]
MSTKIKIDNPLERRLVSDIAIAGMSSVVRGHFDVENLATQLITDAASYVAHQQIKPISDDYHQSQKASRGAGHITQTTIEQQWESQLINDAEFTANRQLPSVTFDVNNSYVSQQLGQRVGEEVSHFYHPTPPPPTARNPRGFWQRTWHSVEDVFEHRALIAEGRAAANSEVMSESLGHVSANQQYYLDLGYTDSVAETRAGWIAATELPLPSVAKGIMQASSLMNRWGVFGRNGAESLSEVKMLPSPRDFYLRKIENPKLYRIIDRLYRPNAKYGAGSTADAVRHELNGKEFLSKSSHIQKAIESRNALSMLIHADQRLSLSDKQIALWVREDLQNALTEQPWDKVYIGRQGMTP